MKKLLNNPHHVVEEMIEGLLVSYPGLACLSGTSVVVRADADNVRDRQVAVLSGGGSGHEPAHAGYVGPGMLSGAVAGEVFTSPSSDSVFAGIKAVTGTRGALLIVKNYTGDRLNFGVAAEMAKAEGIPVEVVIVADDVALAHTQERSAARGIAGTIFVHKIAGAAAAEGRSLLEVAQIARETAAAVGTMGVSLSAGTVPAVGRPSFILGPTEIEVGLGIHGEPGVERAHLQSADALSDRITDEICSVQQLQEGDHVALMVNNLGASTPMEVAIMARRAVSNLQSRKVRVQRVLTGTFMSSLDMAGVSLSLLRLDPERLRLLDAPTSAPAWPRLLAQTPSAITERILSSPSVADVPPRPALPSRFGETTKQAIEAACIAVKEAREQLTELDQMVGDGDLGITLARGAEAVLSECRQYPLDGPAETLRAVGDTLRRTMGGSSGPLYGVLFFRTANALRNNSLEDSAAWAEAILQGCEAISEMGGANLGDRTMLDALIPFAECFRSEIKKGLSPVEALNIAVKVAESSATATAQMKPRRGRSSYLGERTLGHPDPGAVAVAIWLRAVASRLAEIRSST